MKWNQLNSTKVNLNDYTSLSEGVKLKPVDSYKNEAHKVIVFMTAGRSDRCATRDSLISNAKCITY